MESEKYLNRILENQAIGQDSEEMKELLSTRDSVEKLLVKAFENSNPTIRYGGSKSKGTMIKDSYDLDIICYFEHEDNGGGENLKDIYNNVKAALEKDYYVESKTSALRLKSKDSQSRSDFHVDVVPGRYVDDTKTDSYIYQANAEKERLKTNIGVHVKTIKDSGLTDVIKLAKLWNWRIHMNLKTFILELLVVKYAKKYDNEPLSKGLISVWQYLKDNSRDLSVEDPANPEGNDLSKILNDSMKESLSVYAGYALDLVENGNWEGIFGPAESLIGQEKINAIRSVVSSYSNPPNPWSD